MKNKRILSILLITLFSLIISSCGGPKIVLITNITVIGEDDKETLTVGDTLQMIAQLQPDNASNKEVLWTVENAEEITSRSSIAKITDEGRLTGLTVGPVLVKATAKDGSDVEGIKRITIREPTLYNMPMILVRAGSFQMGDTKDEGQSNETPVHTVNLTYDYYIGKYEVVFNESNKYPMVHYNWWDAIDYCNEMSICEDLQPAYDRHGNLIDLNGQVTKDITQVEGYRLPTEAEWEYAARGGHKDIRDGVEANDYDFAGSNFPEEVAWYEHNSNGIFNYYRKHEVGEKAPNELGLYDMSGNVFEWCYDRYGEYPSATQTNPIGPDIGGWHVVRGGSKYHPVWHCRVSDREDYPSSLRYKYIGFRVVKTSR